ITPAGSDRAWTRTSPRRRGGQTPCCRATAHPGLAWTTPKTSAVEADGRAGPAVTGRTAHEALTRTRPIAGSNHRARQPRHRIAVITRAWTVRRGDRFPPGRCPRALAGRPDG